MLRSFTLSPRKLCATQLASLAHLQPSFNKLYDAIAFDVDFVQEALGECGSSCIWGAREVEVYRKVARHQASKPRLLLPNSIYLERSRKSDLAQKARFVLSVGNVQAGEPYQVQLLHTLQSAEHPKVCPGPMKTHCAAISAVARLVHPTRPCVAILTKPLETLALRTRIDVRGVGHLLQTEFGIDVVYVSMRDLSACTLDSNDDLQLSEPETGRRRRISVIYSRYDFSHPTGTFVSDWAEIDPALKNEWTTIERIELSTAVMSSRLGTRLAHRRNVQRALVVDNNLERFLPPDEAARVKQVLPMQWHLGSPSERAQAEYLLQNAPGNFVAKNALRPRTGSGATQDRKASGGDIKLDDSELRELVMDEKLARHYIVYRKEQLQVHDADVVNEGKVFPLRNCAVSELASYGAFVADVSGEILTNAHAGFAVRTRPADWKHCLASQIGFGAVSCVEGVQEN